MRRLFVLAILLLVPSAHAAMSPTNGCPAPCSGQVSSPPGTQLLYVQPAGVGGTVEAYDPSTGRRVLSLPPGITSADGGSHVSAARRIRTTVVSRYTVADGRQLTWFVVDGRWRLAGVSPTGGFAALAKQSGGGRRTDVIVVKHDPKRIVHRLELNGETSRSRPSPATASGCS